MSAVVFRSQTISGIIYSKTDSKPIPYAKIGIFGEDFGVQADENGKYQIELSNVLKDKELIIIVAGYNTFRSKVSDFIKENPHNIYLEEKVTDIEGVTIIPKNYKEKNLGVSSKSKSIHFRPNMDKGTAVVEETALEFNSNKKLKINKINIDFSIFESTEPIKIRYTIYDEKNEKPNNLILNKEIFATISKDQLNNFAYSIDVSKDNIWLQGKFFVGIQFIGKSNGEIALSGALFRTGYYRSFYGTWEKIGVAAPAINIDVKVKK